VERDGEAGVLLDTPALERAEPGILRERLVTLSHLAHRAGFDPAAEPSWCGRRCTTRTAASPSTRRAAPASWAPVLRRRGVRGLH
jgi:hypothetical protein